MSGEVIQPLILILAALVLFASFVQISRERLLPTIRAFAWQGAMVAVVTGLIAVTGHVPGLYFSAALTFLLKALLIPWLLHRLVRHLKLARHREPLGHPILTVVLAVALVIFSYWLVLPIVAHSLSSTRNIIAISLAVVLLGLLMMVVRSQAVAQVLGFMSMENGLFLAAVSATQGMPLVVELGVAFDVMVAAVLFGVFFLELGEGGELHNVDRLNRLDETRDGDL